MNYSGAIAFIFQLTISLLLFSHGHNLQNVPLSKAIVIIPLPPPFFQNLFELSGAIVEALQGNNFTRINL